MNKNTKSLIKRRDALLGEISSLSCILNGSLVERYSTCSRKNVHVTLASAMGRVFILLLLAIKGSGNFTFGRNMPNGLRKAWLKVGDYGP